MEAVQQRLNIAVIGGGVAGLAAAWLLARRHDVTLLERDDRLGGHTNTISVTEGDREIPVDTGFIVCNAKNYPCFYRLLDEWNVPRRDSEMSFGFSCVETGLGYVGPSIRQFMKYRRNLLNPRFLSMIRSQRRFNRMAMRSLERGDLGDQTLGACLERMGMDRFFVHNYLIPLAASVWSSPDTNMLDFPAETFIRFFSNHGMLRLREFPTWQTIVGGSRTYVDRFIKRFPGSIMSSAPVEHVRRTDQGAVVSCTGRPPMEFDHVVLAAHADESLAMLADPTPGEQAALSAWTYNRSDVVLHTDAGVMPPQRQLWASWNYRRPSNADPDDPVPITYDMNRLQGLDAERDYLVSLNLQRPVAPESHIYSVQYTHPSYTPDCIRAQQAIRELDGAGKTHFCGSYMGYGFHEDAVSSACEVARRLGVET